MIDCDGLLTDLSIPVFRGLTLLGSSARGVFRDRG
jgi:hypothetical protein